MKLYYQQQGGFTGLARTCEVEVEQLPENLRQVVLALPGQSRQSASTGRDLTLYKLTLKDADRVVMLEFDDLSLQPGLIELVEYLGRKAMPEEQ